MTLDPRKWLGFAILWARRVIFKMDRLENIELAPLGSSLDSLVDLYGEPAEVEPSEDAEGCTTYKFSTPYHMVLADLLEGKAEMLSYWSSHGHPARDLSHAMEVYGQGQSWRVLTEGFSYMRADNQVMLNCSAIPAIGVTTDAYRQAYRLKSDKQAAPGTSARET